jgi:hypothetical protein
MITRCPRRYHTGLPRHIYRQPGNHAEPILLPQYPLERTEKTLKNLYKFTVHLALRLRIPIRIWKVRAHTGEAGNEKADGAAKLACTERGNDQLVTKLTQQFFDEDKRTTFGMFHGQDQNTATRLDSRTHAMETLQTQRTEQYEQ